VVKKRDKENAMEEEKILQSEAASDTYDAADRPFDFVGADVETALLCESDPALREKIDAEITSMGYQITASASAKDALKNLRYHVYDLIVVNDNFDTDNPVNNEVLNYVANLNMSTRRKMFVVMISNILRTGDSMAALNHSVNYLINLKNISDISQIITSSIADNEEFYHVFRETMRKRERG
jgi:CheY-like chemotaxis protein